MLNKLFQVVRKNRFETLVFTVVFLFSIILMFKTFRAEGGNLKIASKAWSDFAATIPLIRSFSLGNNFPPQYPIFPGPSIRYHFVFFFLVAILEKVGLRIDLALNIPSVFSFFLLCVAIYFLAKTIFKSRAVAFISLILFAFNGSFSFVEFFKIHPLSLNTLKEIVTNTDFSSFGPYDGKIVSAFWNLNIFTNQRHLGLAYAAFLGLILIVYRSSQSPKRLTLLGTILLGLGVGLFPFVHTAVFGMMGIAIAVFFLLYPRLRKKLFIVGTTAALVALPQLLYMGNSQVSFPYFDPGYLIDKLSLGNFLSYWALNLGFVVFLAPLGFGLSGASQKKVVLPFVALFVIGNLFRFSPDMATNHKFFNLFLIGMNVFAAYGLSLFWKKGVLGRAVFILSFFLMTLSGVIDLFPILNDPRVQIADYTKNPASLFIVKNTPPEAIFLNHSFLYDSASLAGRKIYLGWPYFSWSAGYDTDQRNSRMKQILEAANKGAACKLLLEQEIDFIEIQNPSWLEGINVNYSVFEKNFVRIFYERGGNIKIYDVWQSCKK